MNESINNIYIHIPFCTSICGYCDFKRELNDKHTQDIYIKKLVKDLKKCTWKIETLYIGGGTPSCLTHNNLKKLLNIIDNLKFSKKYEATIECNPIDVNDEFLKILKKSKINRLSIGVQSFDDSELLFLQRQHNSLQAIKAIKLAKNYFVNVSIDILYGFKNHSKKSIENSLNIAIENDIKHISFYNLIIKEGSKFKAESNVEDDEIINFINAINSYNRYEIANWSKPNYECHHNINVWNNQDFEAYGFGGCSKINNQIYENLGSTLNWYKKSIEKLSDVEVYQNELILGLRLINGININSKAYKYFENIFIKNSKYFDWVKNRVKVKIEKIDWLNEILLIFM